MNNPPSGLKNSDQNHLNDKKITLGQFEGSQQPMTLFSDWLKKAETAEPNDPSAMSVATLDATGMPNVRIVLMRRFDEHGFVFFTNFESQKGEELLAHQKAAACFHWKSLRKQIRIRGEVEVVSDADADDYFNSRPRGSKLASTASKQSRPLPDRKVFEDAMLELETKHKNQDVPRPPNWSGFRIKPLSIEFWDDGEFRTHDRLRFDRATLNDAWQTVKLFP